MSRGQATVPAKAEPARIRRPNPKISQQLTTVIDTLEPHAAAFGVVGGGMVALALATRELTDVVDEGFATIEQRFDRVDERLDGIDNRLDGIDNRLDGIDNRLDRIDNRLDGIDDRLDRIDGRFAVVEDDVRQIKAQMERMITYVMRDESEPPKRKPPRQR